MNQDEASGCRPKLPEGITTLRKDSFSEDIIVSPGAKGGSKGGSPPLSLELQVEQLTGTVARLTKELETIKASLQEKAKDIETLWENSDIHFDNEKKLQNALKTTSLHLHSRGPVMEGRIERIVARLKGQGNAWLAKRDLHGWLGLKSRQLAHVLYSLCIADGRFETVKRGKYVYLRLRPLSAA
jgi:hypothetical protein